MKTLYVVVSLIFGAINIFAADTNLYCESYSISPDLVKMYVDFKGRNKDDSIGNLTNVVRTTEEIDEALKQSFIDFGINWPNGSSIRYLPRIDRVAIKNTPENIRLFDSIFSETYMITVPIETELQFLSLPRSNLVSFVQGGGIVQTDTLLELFHKGKATLLAAPQVSSIIGVQGVAVSVKLPSGSGNLFNIKMEPYLTPEGTTIHLRATCDLFQANAILPLGQPKMLAGGFPLGEHDLLFIVATVWRVSNEGKKYPIIKDEPTVSAEQASKVAARP